MRYSTTLHTLKFKSLPMALKSYNLEGSRRSGQSLIGNWFEDRAWGSERQNNLAVLRSSAHGYRLVAQPGFEHKKMKSMSQKVYIPPQEQYEKSLRKSAAMPGAVVYNVSGNFRADSPPALVFPRVKPSFHFCCVLCIDCSRGNSKRHSLDGGRCPSLPLEFG
jgi:hypothetical protein